MNAPIDDPGREHLLDDATASYLEAVERGEAPDARAWIARHPDLAPGLSLFFADRAEHQRSA